MALVVCVYVRPYVSIHLYVCVYVCMYGCTFRTFRTLPAMSACVFAICVYSAAYMPLHIVVCVCARTIESFADCPTLHAHESTHHPRHHASTNEMCAHLRLYGVLDTL